MKQLIFTLMLFGIILANGCKTVRYDTERYIKNTIETHKSGEFSNVKILSLYNQTSMKDGTHLKMTAYKYDNQKGLIIAAFQYYLDRKKTKDDGNVNTNTAFIRLDTMQCRAILNNYSKLETRIKKDVPQLEEEIHEDFTVSDELFISFAKSKHGDVPNYLALWIKGEKYTLSTDALLNNLEDFMKY